jgi:replicative DNA helicase
MLDHPDSFSGLPTGLAQLDSMLGCLRPGNLVVVGARPGVGKTGFLLQMARHIAAGLKHPITCGVMSLEMSADELVLRWMAREAALDHMKLLTANMENHEWLRLVNASQSICKWPVVIDDAPMTIGELRSRARFMVREQGVRALFVDYLQLVRVGGTATERTREREVSEVSSALKAIAKELRVPLVAAAQLNRGSARREDRTPKLIDLRESGSIEQDADAIMFLHRDPDAALQADREETKLILAKNRHGPTGVIGLRFHSEQAWFEEDDGNGNAWAESS